MTKPLSRIEKYLKKNPTDLCHATIATLATLDLLEKKSPEVAKSILDELEDQRTSLKLIASENYSSLAVQLSMGNWMTDKYAEGKVGRRFYAGCKNVDAIETLANDELKKLFNCEHAFVQPHSGADANFLAFSAILFERVQKAELKKLGKKTINTLSEEEFENLRLKLSEQKLLGMSLNAGGHLTHGYRMNFSSKMFQAYNYDLDLETQLIDYDKIAQMTQEIKPLILLAGYSAYPRRLNFAKFREIADSVGAVLMVDMAHFAGLVAGKVMTGEENPIPYADVVTSTTHKTLRGPRGGIVLCKEEFAESIDKACPLVMGGPLPHIIAAKAIAFQEANLPEFKQYAQQIVANAKALANRLKTHGIKLVTGGTDNHLIIIDVSPFGLTGHQVEKALRQARLTVNKNTIPNDPNGPWKTSGVRIGTPALTTRGMKEREMEEVADCIFEVLKSTKPSISEKEGQPSQTEYEIAPNVIQVIQERVFALLQRFPLYPEI